MTNLDTFRQLGLFEAAVPRYTSYPAANHFDPTAGERHQRDWLRAVPRGAEVSLYLHIPFCKRLCWFCACRTQGTKTLAPVEAYVARLREEIALVRADLAPGVRMVRLHLGGGTPTILDPATMAGLLDAIFAAFGTAEGFEFSIEIDPTEATDALLDLLVARGLTRASVGVQDFDPKVQGAIGRMQSFGQTARVLDRLRARGLRSLNMDLLYGLPHQDEASLAATIQKVLALEPDRLALYGYAHVPWMSKRQVMIDGAALPSGEARFALAELARAHLCADGFLPIGIDHFARPDDGLARAAGAGRLRRTFQGYTDDPSPVLIGLGASAISRFPEGYAQNAAATAAWQGRIGAGRLAGQRGHALTRADLLRAEIIEALMCRFAVDAGALAARFSEVEVERALDPLLRGFAGQIARDAQGLTVLPEARPLLRLMARAVDAYAAPETRAHSAAV